MEACVTRLIPLVLLLGCKPDPQDPGTTPTGVPVGEPTTTGSGSITPTDPHCVDRVMSTWPHAGRQNVYYRTEIGFWLDTAPAASDALELLSSGSPVAGTSMRHADWVEFVPDQPLQAQTAYTVGLVGCEPSQITWTTSLAGDPVDPAQVSGTTYAVDVESGRWIEPAGVGAVLATALLVDILVGVQAADATTIDVLGGVSLEGSSAQDLCAETAAFPTADFTENPYFELGPQDLTLSVQGALIEMTDLFLSGSFRPDFAGLEGATLTGTLDTRGLVAVVDPNGGDGAVCDLLVGFGVSCTTCPDGTDYCVDAVVDDLVAVAAPGPLVERTAYDIAQDPSCP